MNDSRHKLSRTTVALHWIVGIAIIGTWAVGYYMSSTRTRSLWPWHKSVGIVLLAFIVVRVALRIRNGWLQPVGAYSRIEQRLAKVVHWALVVAMLVMPLSGMVSSYAGGFDISVFGWTVIPENRPSTAVDPGSTRRPKVIPRSPALHDFLGELHTVVAWFLAAGVLLHVVGALKHHFVDKDGTMRRMLGARVE